MYKVYWQLVCDNCGGTINDYHHRPLLKTIKKDGAIVSKGKQYCCERCKEAKQEVGVA